MQWNSSSPLFAHWRHRPVVSVRKGVRPATITNNNTTTTTTTTTTQNNNNNNDGFSTERPVFCEHSDALEKTLRPLHLRLRSGERKYQAEIDRYLVAVQSPRFEHLVLARSSVPHYDNLPDLSYFAIGILDPSKDMDIEVQQIFLMLRQCTPLRRRTKRAQRELQWHRESIRGMQVMVRCMLGTLLGLYPTCARPVAFKTRVEVFRLVRSMLVSDFSTLNMCMQQIRYIIKICVMEHLCNTVSDYHPGLCHMLNKSGQQMRHFTHAVSTMCDTFRSELNQLHASHGFNLIAALPALEKSAHSFFERCTRAYRGIITNQGAVMSSVEYLRKHVMAPGAGCDFVKEMMGPHIFACKSQYIFEIVHRDRMMDKGMLESAWHTTQCVRVHALPQCILDLQKDALRRRYQHDSVCMERCRRLHVCILCACKRISVSSAQPQCTKMRQDCVTGEYICVSCNLPSIVEVDILGRIAQIGDHVITLSCCCASLIYYTASGSEFSTRCGLQCIRKHQFSKGRAPVVMPPQSSQANMLIPQQQHQQQQQSGKRRQQQQQQNNQPSSAAAAAALLLRTSACLFSHQENCVQVPNEGAPVAPCCFVCGQRNASQTFQVLSVANRAMRTCGLCSRHHLHTDIIDTIGDDIELERALACNSKLTLASSSSSAIFGGGKQGGRVSNKH